MANATTRAKRLNETKMILRQPLLLIAIILSFALLLLFVLYGLHLLMQEIFALLFVDIHFYFLLNIVFQFQ